MTFLAPALAANMQRIPVPLPTSSTTLSLKRCLLWNMEFRYVRVRTSSFSISYRGHRKNPQGLHIVSQKQQHFTLTGKVEKCNFFISKMIPHGCQSGHMSQSSSPLMSYPQLQAWLNSPPEKPQTNIHSYNHRKMFASSTFKSSVYYQQYVKNWVL